MFNSNKYKESSATPSSQNYGNRGYSIGFNHLISGKEIYFKAFIESYNETFSSDWSPETIYGRSDNIQTYRDTTRNISLSFKVPAFSEGESYENLAKVQSLIQFLYPSYTSINGDSAGTIMQPPFVKLKVMNLVQNNFDDSTVTNFSSLFDQHVALAGAENGVVGAILSLNVDHNLINTEASIIEKSSGRSGESGAAIIPTLFTINLSFKAIHNYPLGWNTENFESQMYPFSARLGESTTAVEEGATNQAPTESGRDAEAVVNEVQVDAPETPDTGVTEQAEEVLTSIKTSAVTAADGTQPTGDKVPPSSTPAPDGTFLASANP